MYTVLHPSYISLFGETTNTQEIACHYFPADHKLQDSDIKWLEEQIQKMIENGYLTPTNANKPTQNRNKSIKTNESEPE